MWVMRSRVEGLFGCVRVIRILLDWLSLFCLWLGGSEYGSLENSCRTPNACYMPDRQLRGSLLVMDILIYYLLYSLRI